MWTLTQLDCVVCLMPLYRTCRPSVYGCSNNYRYSYCYCAQCEWRFNLHSATLLHQKCHSWCFWNANQSVTHIQSFPMISISAVKFASWLAVRSTHSTSVPLVATWPRFNNVKPVKFHSSQCHQHAAMWRTTYFLLYYGTEWGSYQLVCEIKKIQDRSNWNQTYSCKV